jgi:hypothetical protein
MDEAPVRHRIDRNAEAANLVACHDTISHRAPRAREWPIAWRTVQVAEAIDAREVFGFASSARAGVQVRLRSVARRRVGVTPPRFQRQSGGLGADEPQPHRNSERARGSQSDHDSRGWQKPEVSVRDRTGSPPSRSCGPNVSHDT